MNECKEHKYRVQGEMTDGGCPYCEIDRLTAQLDASRALLAERDKLIENQQAEIESRNQLRYDALKGEHSRSPYYYDSWCKLHDHKGVVGTSDKPPIYYAVNLLNKLTEQNAALRAEIARLQQQSVGWVQVFDENAALREEIERLKVEVLSLQCPSDCAREADARKQAAQEIVYMLRTDRWAESELRDIVDKFGLEG